MPYSKRRETLEVLRPTLAVLESGRECEWDVRGRNFDAEYLAHKIREALHIAGLYESEYPALASVARRVSIRVSGTTVRAVFTDRKAGLSDLPASAVRGGRELAQIDVLSTRESIVAAWSASANRQTPLVFMQVRLSAEEMQELWEWANVLGLVLLPDGEKLVVARKNDDNEVFAWTPEDGWPLP